MAIDIHSAPWVKGAVSALGISLGGFIILGGALYNHDRDNILQRIDDIELAIVSKRSRVNALSELVVRTVEHVEQKEKEWEYWHNRIEENSKRALQISTNALSRPDPFTGTMGREMDRRLGSQFKSLESRIDKLELNCNTSNHTHG